MPADADDDSFRGDLPPVGQLHDPRADEPGGAGLLEHLGPDRAQVSGELLLLVQPVDGPLGVLEQLRQVDARRGADQAEGGELLTVADHACRARENAGRRAAVIGARSTESIALHDRDRGAELSAVQRGGHSGRSAAEHQQVEAQRHRSDDRSQTDTDAGRMVTSMVWLRSAARESRSTSSRSRPANELTTCCAS